MTDASAAPSVVLADDHPLVRLSVRADLEEAGFRVCAEAATADEAIEAALREQPDLCLLDISMPGGGLRAAGVIARSIPTAKVVVLTASSREEDVLDAVRVGAFGYVLKEDDPGRIAAVLRDVLDGTPAFPRRFMAAILLAARVSLGSADAR